MSMRRVVLLAVVGLALVGCRVDVPVAVGVTSPSQGSSSSAAEVAGADDTDVDGADGIPDRPGSGTEPLDGPASSDRPRGDETAQPGVPAARPSQPVAAATTTPPAVPPGRAASEAAREVAWSSRQSSSPVAPAGTTSFVITTYECGQPPPQLPPDEQYALYRARCTVGPSPAPGYIPPSS